MSSPNSAHAIGGRLRRLSERIDQDCARLYADQGLRFEQRWFASMSALAQSESLSVKQLAEKVGLSHASISETRKSLLVAGLIQSRSDPLDGRSVRLCLSAKGRAMFTRFAPLWQALEAVSAELDAEAGHIVHSLELLDQALDRASLHERVNRKLKVR